LGLRQADAEWLREVLLLAVTNEDASVVRENRFGTLYVLDFIVRTPLAPRSFEALGSYSSGKISHD